MELTVHNHKQLAYLDTEVTAMRRVCAGRLSLRGECHVTDRLLRESTSHSLSRCTECKALSIAGRGEKDTGKSSSFCPRSFCYMYNREQLPRLLIHLLDFARRVVLHFRVLSVYRIKLQAVQQFCEQFDIN
jgi:hypothetical protein